MINMNEAASHRLTCGLVILNYRNYSLTEELLAHIKDFPEIDYIAVVDNDSPNDSYTQLKKYENDKISVLQSGRNGGYSYGNNFGAKYLIKNHHPDIIGIANPDVIFDGSLVECIKEVFAANPDYAVLTGFQIKPSGENAGHPFWEDEGTPKGLFGYTLRVLLTRPLTRFFYKLMHIPHYVDYVESIRTSNNIPHQVWAVEGSLFFIRSKDFEAAGFLDENVFLYWEEDILAFKINNWLHKKAGVVNSVSYVHAHKDSDIFSKQKKDLDVQNASATYYFRNYVTSSKILHVIYSLLILLSYPKLCLVHSVKKLLHLYNK